MNASSRLHATNPAELASAIDSSGQAWAAGREQLFNGQIPAWLRATGYAGIDQAWESAKASYEDDKDAGLEAFLHLLSPDLASPGLDVSPKGINFDKMRPGASREQVVTVRNPRRGHLSGTAYLNPERAGFSLEPVTVASNNLLDENTALHLGIDTAEALSGKSNLVIETVAGKESIPLSYKTVFPYPLLYPWIGMALGVLLSWLVVASSPVGQQIDLSVRKFIPLPFYAFAGYVLGMVILRSRNDEDAAWYVKAIGPVAGLLIYAFFGISFVGKFPDMTLAVFALAGFGAGYMILSRVDFPRSRGTRIQAQIAFIALPCLAGVAMLYQIIMKPKMLIVPACIAGVIIAIAVFMDL